MNHSEAEMTAELAVATEALTAAIKAVLEQRKAGPQAYLVAMVDIVGTMIGTTSGAGCIGESEVEQTLLRLEARIHSAHAFVFASKTKVNNNPAS